MEGGGDGRRENPSGAEPVEAAQVGLSGGGSGGGGAALVGEKDIAVARRGVAPPAKGQRRAVRRWKGERCATAGAAVRGAKRGGSKGGAPTRHGRGTPQELRLRGEGV